MRLFLSRGCLRFRPIFQQKLIPSWYAVASEDRAINPDLQRFMAKRIGATTSEIKASHVPFITHPGEVVTIIEAAARARAK